MSRIDRYLLSQLLSVFAFFTLVLVAVYWVNRAARLFDAVVGDGQSFWVVSGGLSGADACHRLCIRCVAAALPGSRRGLHMAPTAETRDQRLVVLHHKHGMSLCSGDWRHPVDRSVWSESWR